jgi:hypothetical protein
MRPHYTSLPTLADVIAMSSRASPADLLHSGAQPAANLGRLAIRMQGYPAVISESDLQRPSR